MSVSSAALIEALRDVEDPELPVSIVDLGLIVAADIVGDTARVSLTLTSMGCPAVDMILDDVRDRLLREPGIAQVEVEIVWEPVWTKDRLSEEARMQLREWGLAV